MSNLEAFRKRFGFNPELAFRVGIEREHFLADESGSIVPRAKEVLDYLSTNRKIAVPDIPMKPNGVYEPFGYELSACQIEIRTTPTKLSNLATELKALDVELEVALNALHLRRLYIEVGPDDMPLDVFPDPSRRYATISSRMSDDVLLAACQVAGTHVHVGMPDHETALRVYNNVIKHCGELCKIGDGSSGKRLKIYRKVEPNCLPQQYESWHNLYQVALSKDFAEDPRSCWTLIRITVHGTLEFRMFGTVKSIKSIVDWASKCRTLCVNAAG